MEFKDRVANKPNRVKLTYEDSGVSTFVTVELADEPIEEGTPLNALNMNKLLNKEDNDYIVEQGTSGIWTYRKWNSGIAECWGVQSVSVPSVSKEWGQSGSTVYYSDSFGGARYPFNFSSAPLVNFNFLEPENKGLIVVNYSYARFPDYYSPLLFAYSHVPYTNETEGYIQWSIKGRWK